MREIKTAETLQDLSILAAEEFICCAADAVGRNGRFSVALAGGNTPGRLYSLLADLSYSEQVKWDKVHFFWGDERCVPPSDPKSNFKMVEDALLRHITIPLSNVHRIQGEKPPLMAAQSYENELKAFFGAQLPVFDLVLLGLGQDGHTASLFPGSQVFSETGRWAAAVENAPLVDRVTLTLPVLNNAREVIFLVSGSEKAKMVKEILSDPPGTGKYPAGRVNPIYGRVLWLVDGSALAGTSRPA